MVNIFDLIFYNFKRSPHLENYLLFFLCVICLSFCSIFLCLHFNTILTQSNFFLKQKKLKIWMARGMFQIPFKIFDTKNVFLKKENYSKTILNLIFKFSFFYQLTGLLFLEMEGLFIFSFNQTKLVLILIQYCTLLYYTMLVFFS